MSFTDNFKLRTVLEESIISLKFLDSVKPQDDISSELAGYQISKLLKNQEENQRRFAELVLKRANLTQITQKRQLEIVQAEIANLSIILKESTKKLCKIFKQNPDLEADSLKVSRERNTLILKLKEFMQFIKNSTAHKFMTFINHELESQDQMRRLLEKEKNFNIQIKKLQQEKTAESKDYQKQIAQNQAKIQEFKEALMQKMDANKIQLEYIKRQASAELSNQKRILQQTHKTLKNELQNLKTAVKTEKLVHGELQDYLKAKTEEIKKKLEQLGTKNDESTLQHTKYMEQIDEKIRLTKEELDDFKKRYQDEQDKKITREKIERDKIIEKKKKEQMLVRMDNAVKYIQNSYLAWKEAGGGKKKQKR